MSQRSFTLKQAWQRPIILIQGLVLPLLLLGLWQYNSSLGASHAYAFVPLQDIYFAFIKLLETGELWLNTWGSLKKSWNRIHLRFDKRINFRYFACLFKSFKCFSFSTI